MNTEDLFVEKVVLHNKLASPDQVSSAKQAMVSAPGKSLLAVLVEQGAVAADRSASIRQMFAAYKAKQTGAPAEPASAAAPAAAPASTSARGRIALGGASASSAPGGGLGAGELDDFLLEARRLQASDLHLNTGCQPVIRRHGRLQPMNRGPLAAEETEKLLMSALSTTQRQEIRKSKALDFCYRDRDGNRYRTCILRQRLGWDGAFRVINTNVPTFEELGLPDELKRLTEFAQGLVLVTGPSGCGKSTTLAAMVDLINRNRDEHIITIEDPVEYLFNIQKSHINQREVGSHTKTFSAALRASLREDPDVIMIGELRDLETTSLAITAAETGHLVFGTLHTISAARTIDRVLDVFPPDEQGQIRAMISESIRGIVCQQLIPRKDGNGRALALEVLFNTPAVANTIRERKLHQLPSVMQTGRKLGMILMDNSLLNLVNQGVIDGTEAFYAADNREQFMQWAPKV
ncbi:MAG: type IV pilus twitching motility protein PilT [Planctomycetes bacterium]|nr:type IV pilus twitching motility protein PilT [Planctomycetota bacterium]